MKELKSFDEKPILQSNYPTVPKKHERTKRWVIAQGRKNYRAQVMQNSCLEASYHRIIECVKTLYLKPPEIYYERDHKTDKSESFLTMHSFITPTFYWHLECDFCYDYQVHFAFHNCYFEADIRKMLIAFPLEKQATEKVLKPDFNTFYATVLKVQEPRFFHSL